MLARTARPSGGERASLASSAHSFPPSPFHLYDSAPSLPTARGAARPRTGRFDRSDSQMHRRPAAPFAALLPLHRTPLGILTGSIESRHVGSDVRSRARG